MKKILAMLMTFTLVFALAGCGGSDETPKQNTSALQYKTYTFHDEVQGNQKVILGYAKDQVKSIEMQMMIPYSGLTKAEIEEALNKSIEHFTKAGGTEAKADYGTDEARLVVKMNLDKMKLDQLADFGLNLADDAALKANALTLQTAENRLKEMGFEAQA